jgi:RNA polymerase sigma factor (sigma-70 family)
MDGNQLGGLLRYLRRITDAGAEGASDGQLLERFARQRDEAAFTALLERHGPMVLGVCRRILHDPHDAEDAFQATFLVLAHKARSIGRPQAIASWLYRTAQRTALRAKFQRSRRRAHESVLDDLPAPETTEDLAWHELRPTLDDEVNRLPRKYRDAVVHCYLQEKTYTEAAKALGLAAGTVSSRLARARDILRKRLLRRGLTLSSSLLVVLLSRQALSAAVPSALRDATTQAALRLLAGQTTLAAATPAVATLTEGVLHAMFLTKLKIATLLVLGAVCTGSAVFIYNSTAGGLPGPAPAEKIASDAPKPDGEKNANENPDPGDRWLRAAQRPNLSAREKAAYEQLAKVHRCAFQNVTWTARSFLDLGKDSDGPMDVLYRMGLDVLPQLAEALDDRTPTKTVTILRPGLRRAGEEGEKKVWLVNELVARLIVELASHDFVLDTEPGKGVGNPPGIRDLNVQPHPVPDFRKAVWDWYAANRDKTPVERKVADVTDRWVGNRLDAIRWLGEQKSDAGRRAIEQRADAIITEIQKASDTLIWSELSLCGLALGQIGDKASLPQVRAVCRCLSDTNDFVWATSGWGVSPSTFFEAFQGLALLGEKEEAFRGLKAAYEKHKDKMGAEQQQELQRELDKARQW